MSRLVIEIAVVRKVRSERLLKSTHNELLFRFGGGSGCFGGAGSWRAFFRRDSAGGLAFGIGGAGLRGGAAGGRLVLFHVAGEFTRSAAFLSCKGTDA